MLWTIVLLLLINKHDALEPTDYLVPAGWKGNPWGPEAAAARESGKLPRIEMTPGMKRWDTWGRNHLKDGDIVFRRGKARILAGYFPMSRFIANASDSPFSHTAIVAFEKGEPVVYDTTSGGVRRQPFAVWVLDNAGPFGVKRLKSKYAKKTDAVLAYCRSVFETQPPFDYDLAAGDSSLYCVEMTEMAFRSAGIKLSEPIRLGDMDRAAEFPICMYCFATFSHLKLEQSAFFPGNDRTGIWSSPNLETVCPPTGPVGSPDRTTLVDPPADSAEVADQGRVKPNS